MASLLLITSTIAPTKGVPNLARTDPLERLKDYQLALGFYLKALDRGDVDAIVYVDNSGYDLSSLRQMAGDRKVEFISYRSDVPAENNRFFLEAHLIEHFIKNSAFLSAAPDAHVWKVTGRYIIRNFRRIVRGCPESRDICINLRNRPIPTVDFYLVRFKQAAFRRLVTTRLADFEGVHNDERALRKVIDANPDTSILCRLPATPRIDGVRGWDGTTYEGLKGTLKYYARAACASLLPFVWI